MSKVLVIPCLPLRRQPTHKSEMISQLLFGETFEVREEQNSWLYIECSHDKYCGWVENLPSLFENESTYEKMPQVVLKDHVEISNEIRKCRIPFGSILGTSSFILIEEAMANSSLNHDQLDALVQLMLGAPYLWGGRTSYGIDCSGLVQLYGRMLNLELPRDSGDQAKIGEDVLLNQFKRGDLLFFGLAEGKITHVGIALDDQNIFHASGFVRIDAFDGKGIWNEGLKKYTHTLQFGKRITKP